MPWAVFQQDIWDWRRQEGQRPAVSWWPLLGFWPLNGRQRAPRAVKKSKPEEPRRAHHRLCGRAQGLGSCGALSRLTPWRPRFAAYGRSQLPPIRQGLSKRLTSTALSAAFCPGTRQDNAAAPLSLRIKSTMRGQRRACAFANCLYQKPHCSRIPIDSIDRSIPVFGHHVGCMASFHPKAHDGTRWHRHNRRFDRLQAAERSLDSLEMPVTRRRIVQFLDFGCDLLELFAQCQQS